VALTLQFEKKLTAIEVKKVDEVWLIVHYSLLVAFRISDMVTRCCAPVFVFVVLFLFCFGVSTLYGTIFCDHTTRECVVLGISWGLFFWYSGRLVRLGVRFANREVSSDGTTN